MAVVHRLDRMTNPPNRGSTVNGPGPWRAGDTSVVVTANRASAANPARHALARASPKAGVSARPLPQGYTDAPSRSEFR